MFKLYDYINVATSEKLTSLNDKEKADLISSVTSTRKTKKGLFITYDLTHSGRRINNRIYGTQGQQNGTSTVMSPYPKPILQHHDRTKDPIGRFVSAEWQDLSKEAMSFFNNVQDFMEVKDAYESDDPERIYAAMKKYNLLTNKNWPGLGRIRVKAQITDKEAIEKFMDGRYITFSAGSTTDRHVCSICNEDWAQGNFCEHKHGKIYDGEVCVFITGKFNVLEGSVVNMPADDLSQLQSMEFIQDNLNNTIENFDLNTKVDSIVLSDSLYSLEDYSMKNEKEESPTEEVNMKQEQKDSAESSVEFTAELEDKLIKRIYDKILENHKNLFERIEDNEKEKEVEEPIEGIDSKAEEKKNEQEESVSSDGASVRGVQTVVQDEATSEEKVIGDTDGDINKIVENAVVLDVEDLDVDWYLLDAGLQFELGDKALTTEQRKELPDSDFCGPERSFPVNDCAHVTAARRMLGRAKLSDSQKAKVMSCIEKKAKMFQCDESKNSDFEKDISDLRNEIKALKELLSGENKEQTKEIKDEAVVENPSIASSDERSTPKESLRDNLGNYEKKIIKKYNEILQTDGEIKANDYFISKSRYLKKGFDPKKYIN
jgi:hypothetical protein